MPSKLGRMLASGRPVIAAVRGDGAVATAPAGGAGVVTPPGDAMTLADAIRTLAGVRRAGPGSARPPGRPPSAIGTARPFSLVSKQTLFQS